MLRIFALSVFLAALAMPAFGQIQATPDDEDVQSWNDVQLTVPLSKQVDVFTKVTVRLGKNISRFTDDRFAIGVVWKPLKYLSISPFYWYINARNTTGQFRIENRLNLAATYKFPIKRFGLSHRSTYERRMRPLLNSWRYRAAFLIEKDIPKKVIPAARFIVSDEVFYDSLTKRFSRNRFAIGISKTLSKQLTLDVFYMRQNDGFSHPGDLNIIGTQWKIKL